MKGSVESESKYVISQHVSLAIYVDGLKLSLKTISVHKKMKIKKPILLSFSNRLNTHIPKSDILFFCFYAGHVQGMQMVFDLFFSVMVPFEIVTHNRGQCYVLSYESSKKLECFIRSFNVS